MSFALFAAAALGASLVSGPGVPLLTTPVDAAVDARGLVVVDGVVLAIVDGTGAILDGLAHDAVRVALYDVDGDGLDDVVTCGPSGVGYLPWVAGLGAPVALDGSPCQELATHAGGIAAAGVDVLLLDEGYYGPVPTVIPAGLTAPRLAASDDAVAWADAGASAWWERDAYGVSSHVVGTGVVDLAVSPDGFWVAEPAVLSDPAQTRTPTSTPVALDAADVDGDGISDLIVAYSGLAGVLLADGSPELTLPATGFLLGAGDLDGDGCAEVMFADAGLPGIATIEEADCDPDADGDGHGRDTDCNDADPAVFPGAVEACDTLDNDCDGLVDEPGNLSLSAEPALVREGDEVVITASADGCTDGLAPLWTVVPERVLDCALSGLIATCTARDNAVARVTFEVTSGSVATTVPIANESPRLVLPRGLQDGLLEMDVGESWSQDIGVEDPGDDSHTFALAGTYDADIRISPWGELAVNPRNEGSFRFDISVADDDGGLDKVAVVLEVRDPYQFGDNAPEELFSPEPDDKGGCGCTTGRSGAVGWLLPLALVLARRRS